jgi:hypothetical protein
MYLKFFISDFCRIGNDSPDFLSNFLIAFWELCNRIKSHSNQVPSGINSCEIKSNELVKNFFLLNSPEIVWFSFLFSLFDLFLNRLHLLDVMVQEILFDLRSVLGNSVFQNRFALSSDCTNQVIKFLVFFQEICPSGPLSKDQVGKNIDSTSGLLEHTAGNISQGQTHALSQNCLVGSFLTEESPDQSITNYQLTFSQHFKHVLLILPLLNYVLHLFDVISKASLHNWNHFLERIVIERMADNGSLLGPILIRNKENASSIHLI